MDNIITSNTLSPEISKKIYDLEVLLKSLKDQEAEIKKALYEAMEKNGIVKIDTDEMAISYIYPTTRETLDSKLLKEELPDIYDSYVKITNVKGSVRIKIK